MLRSLVASFVLLLPLAAHAGDMVLNDIRAQNGVQLSADELNTLLPNASVVSYFSGSTRTWKNEPDGTLKAYSDAGGAARRLQAQVTAHGSWHIGRNGAYCVTLEWPKKTEKWCKYLFKVDGRYFGVKTLDEGTAPAHAFEFSQ